MFNTQFERPAMVLLSAVWSLAAALAIAAFAVSVLAEPRAAVAPASHTVRMVEARPAESGATSSMLREPRLAIGKNKLD